VVRSVILGNKIQIVYRSRGESRHDGVRSRVGYRTRGKPSYDIGVKWAVASKIFPCQIPAEVRDAIDDGRVALEGHTFSQSIVYDGGNQASLLRTRGLLLDNGSDGDDFPFRKA